MTIRAKRIAIGIYEISTGLVEVVLGVALLMLSASGLEHIADRLMAEELGEDSRDMIIRFVQDHLPSMLHGKGVFTAILIAFGSVKVAGGIGFLRGKSWGYYLLLGLLVVLLPPNVYRLVTHPGIGFVSLLIIHLAVLQFLVHYRNSFIHHAEPYDHDRHGKSEQAQGTANDVSGT
ncbi:MAG: DUF2127 domain-containing protein [Candidatus Uhrbacteria bacterium]